MKRAVAMTMAMLAAAAFAAERKTFSYTCRGGSFTIAAVVDTGSGQWSKSDPVILQVDGEPPQTLVADSDAPDADSYNNKDFEFYALTTFITLTHKSHGVVVKFYDGCRRE